MFKIEGHRALARLTQVGEFQRGIIGNKHLVYFTAYSSPCIVVRNGSRVVGVVWFQPISGQSCRQLTCRESNVCETLIAA